MQEITVSELKKRLDAGTAPKIVDVREDYEWDAGHLDAATHIQMNEFAVKVMGGEYADWKNDEIVVCCRSGGRSGNVANLLAQNGFKQVKNLVGGMTAWRDEIDNNMTVA